MRPWIAITAIAVALAVNPASGQEMDYGEAEFMASCAACHGDDGRGGGPLAEELRTAPADLTALSSRNGGEFPYQRIVAMIDGRYIVPGHGTREMPAWGREFLMGDVETYGPIAGEEISQERVRALAAYIASLQK